MKENLKRRRILQATGGALAVGVGAVGTAAANDSCTDGLNGDGACEASITFDNQSVHSSLECVNDCAVYVQSAYLPCGGFIDIHDTTRTDTFGAGYPLGATVYLEPGTYSDVEICLYEGNGAFGTCVDWNQLCLQEEKTLSAMLHVDTDDNELFTHYCQHDSEVTGTDHAYVCDGSPVLDKASVSP